jgi:hypothetical protein
METGMISLRRGSSIVSGLAFALVLGGILSEAKSNFPERGSGADIFKSIVERLRVSTSRGFAQRMRRPASSARGDAKGFRNELRNDVPAPGQL